MWSWFFTVFLHKYQVNWEIAGCLCETGSSLYFSTETKCTGKQLGVCVKLVFHCISPQRPSVVGNSWMSMRCWFSWYFFTDTRFTGKQMDVYVKLVFTVFLHRDQVYWNTAGCWESVYVQLSSITSRVKFISSSALQAHPPHEMCLVEHVPRYHFDFLTFFPFWSYKSSYFCVNSISWRWSDRHRYLESGNMPKTDGGQIHLNFMTVLWYPWSWSDT